MTPLRRVTRDPALMSGKQGVLSIRVTVGTVVGLLAAGRSTDEILEAHPYLEGDDIREALACTAWRAEEQGVPLVQP